ncbi:MAG: 16S rRNA (cytidine(1402)-2'-O)-methyltransferase [Alphaproteobacteria bacterium]
MVPIPDNGQSSVSPETDGAHPSDALAPSKRPAAPLSPGLYIVATPIGNLGDLSERALSILSAADVVACEDTRVTGKLLSLRGIKSRMIAYHDHSSDSVREHLIERLKNGETVALVSDAGTPLISDPGYKLVAAAVESGAHVTAAPGPASPLAALVLSGLPSDRFLFAGYLPSRDKARRDTIAEFASLRATLIFLESPRRLGPALTALAEGLGNRPAAVARELTKLYEEVTRGRLADLADTYRDKDAPKGEVVVVVGPPEDAPPGEEDIDTLLKDALAGMSVRDAAATVAAATGAPRKDIYRRALELSGNREADGQ